MPVVTVDVTDVVAEEVMVEVSELVCDDVAVVVSLDVAVDVMVVEMHVLHRTGHFSEILILSPSAVSTTNLQSMLSVK